MALAGAVSLLANDSIDGPPPAAETAAEAPAPQPHIGRFQLSEAGNFQLVIDTATGRVWQVNRKMGEVTMSPVHYEHADEAKTPLPDYTPPPKQKWSPVPLDPEVEAERQATAQKFVNETIHASIMTYATQVGQFPGSLAQLATNLGRSPRWQGPYINETLIDPWGNRYQYVFPGVNNPDTYDVWSLGPDGVMSTDDIGNW